MKVELCPECRLDGGWHYDEDGHATRPHHEAAATKAAAQRIVELAHEEQTKTARSIISDAAESMFEFSANNIREQVLAAGIEGPVVGAAFTWAETNGLIEATGRSVQSTDPATRHRLNVWRSTKHVARGSRDGYGLNQSQDRTGHRVRAVP